MTTSATVWAWLFIHIGVVLVVSAYFTAGAVLVPSITARARERVARAAWLPALVGLAASLPWLGGGIVLVNLPSAVLKFIGAAMITLWVLAGLLGGAGIAQHIGAGSRDGQATWTDTIRGGLCLSLTWILPLVGWLVMLPATMATGVGCLLLGPFPPRRTAPPSAPAAPPIVVNA